MTATTDTTQSDSGTGTTQADVAAAARAAASAAQTAATQAAAAADNAQAAATSFTQTESVPDISQAEAYMLNMKRLVANELNVDAQLNSVLIGSLQRLTIMAERSLASYLEAAQRATVNGATQDKQNDGCATSERERTVRVGDVSNTVQQAALSDNPVLQDAAVAAAIVAGIKAYNEQKPA